MTNEKDTINLSGEKKLHQLVFLSHSCKKRCATSGREKRQQVLDLLQDWCNVTLVPSSQQWKTWKGEKSDMNCLQPQKQINDSVATYVGRTLFT